MILEKRRCKSCEKKSCGGEDEGGADAVGLGEFADGVGRGGADDASEVVGHAHGSAAEGGGEGLRCDDGEAGEEAGTEESDYGAEEQDGGSGAGRGVDGDDGGGDHKIEDVDILSGWKVIG